MTRVLVTMWSGAVALHFDAAPGPAELAKIEQAYTGRNCGVRPHARVVETLRIPSYSASGEAVCEDRLR